MGNSIVDAYLGDWEQHIAERYDSVRGLLILPDSELVSSSCIKALNGSILYIEAAGEVERSEVIKFAGFSFERVYIIDTGILSDRVLAILRAKLRSPVSIGCKMFINVKD